MNNLTEKLNVSDQDFWYKLENENSDKILKYSEDGIYDIPMTPEYKEFMDCLHDLPDIPNINVGDVVEGVISSINRKEIIIDINYKDSIFVDIKSPDLKIVENLKKGDKINVMIISISEKPFEIKGSITELIKIGVSNKLRTYYKENIPIKIFVKEMIPAGFMVDAEIDNIIIDAFMPNTLAGVNKLTESQSKLLVGKEIDVMLETLQQDKGVYVVSRKKYLKSLIKENIQKIKEDLKIDKEKVYRGFVTGTKDFGVFVEFNECLTGMIHKVNINPKWQERLNEIKPGTPIDFYIRDILKGNRIILTQILRKSLWDTIRIGNIKEGKIISIKPFGALVSLDQETMGLIQNIYIKKSGKTLKKGDKLKVKVISVIKDDRKIYLDFD